MALGWSAGALAQIPEAPKKFYAGLGIGKAKANLDDGDSAAFGIVSQTSKDETDTVYKFFVGYQLFKYFGLELGYTDFGKFAYNFTSPTGAPGKMTYKANSTALSAIGAIPLMRDFSLTGRVGVTSNRARRSAFEGFTVIPPAPEATNRKTSLTWGAGIQYDFSSALAMRLEYEDYGKFGKVVSTFGSEETGRATIHMYSLNFIARF
jgi:OmpA-OmpF porin, OOP family